MEEIFAFVDGRSIVLNCKDLVSLRKQELDTFRKGMPPPERFVTRGSASAYFKYPQVLDDLNLLKDLEVCSLIFSYKYHFQTPPGIKIYSVGKTFIVGGRMYRNTSAIH